jgi:hypothetical protein
MSDFSCYMRKNDYGNNRLTLQTINSVNHEKVYWYSTVSHQHWLVWR